MNSHYDLELKAVLKDLIDSGDIEIKEPDHYFKIIEDCYPTLNNRIDWENVDGFIAKYIDEMHKDKEIAQFFDMILKEDLSLNSEQVSVLGDDLINFAYKMKFTKFKELAHIFFSIPQHTYVIFEDSRKCINFTFESDIYFGSPTN
jgi:hypothetical protein